MKSGNVLRRWASGAPLPPAGFVPAADGRLDLGLPRPFSLRHGTPDEDRRADEPLPTPPHHPCSVRSPSPANGEARVRCAA